MKNLLYFYGHLLLIMSGINYMIVNVLLCEKKNNFNGRLNYFSNRKIIGFHLMQLDR